MKGKIPSNSSPGTGGITWSAVAVLGVLLVLPVLALRSADRWLDWRWVAIAWGLWCGITYFLFRSDKQRAESGAWRIPESTLHLAELIGGWPGAYLAQRVFRHKISKPAFQVFFWIIVLAHEYLAGDYLADWRFSKDVLSLLKTFTA